MKTPVKVFVDNVLSCVGAPYKSPGTVNLQQIQNGAGVDCSGLLTAASGGMIYHGSNTIFRTELTDSGSISDGRPTDPYPQSNPLRSGQLRLGMAVFKHTNDDVKHDGRGNYCHIGVVTGVNPLRITHASSEKGCVTHDSSIGKWCAWGLLSDVDYGAADDEPQKEEIMGNYTLQVTASALRVREQPDVNSAQIGRLKLNDIVHADALVDGWYQLVGCGYVSANYVKVIGQQEQQTDVGGSVIEQLTKRIAVLQEQMQMVLKAHSLEVGDDE